MEWAGQGTLEHEKHTAIDVLLMFKVIECAGGLQNMKTILQWT